MCIRRMNPSKYIILPVLKKNPFIIYEHHTSAIHLVSACSFFVNLRHVSRTYLQVSNLKHVNDGVLLCPVAWGNPISESTLYSMGTSGSIRFIKINLKPCKLYDKIHKAINFKYIQF